MKPVAHLCREHARMRRALVRAAELLDAAQACDPEEKRDIVCVRLPETQREFFAVLKEHEELEDILFEEVRALDADALPWEELEKQHAALSEVFGLASVLIQLRENENLYPIGVTLRRVSKRLSDHFEYEEKFVFPRIGAMLSLPKTEAALKRLENRSLVVQTPRPGGRP